MIQIEKISIEIIVYSIVWDVSWIQDMRACKCVLNFFEFLFMSFQLNMLWHVVNSNQIQTHELKGNQFLKSKFCFLD